MANAVGILEVFGLTTAFVAADAACKAADVTLENFDKNKPANADKLPVPLLVTIKIRGDVSAVEAGLKAAREVAESLTGVVAEHIIPNPAAISSWSFLLLVLPSLCQATSSSL